MLIVQPLTPAPINHLNDAADATQYLLESIAAVTVVDVFVAQNRDGSRLLVVRALEASTGRTARGAARAWIRSRSGRLRIVRVEAGLLLALLAQRCYRRVALLSLRGRRQILVGWRLARSIQEVAVTGTTLEGGAWGRSTVQVVEPGCTSKAQECTEQQLDVPEGGEMGLRTCVFCGRIRTFSDEHYRLVHHRKGSSWKNVAKQGIRHYPNIEHTQLCTPVNYTVSVCVCG